MTIFPSHDFVKDFEAIRSYGEENMDLVDDPAGGPLKVMRVFYPNGIYTKWYLHVATIDC